MSDDQGQSPADHLYSEGMKYDLAQDKSPAAASLARANFQRSAAMGHRGARRALAHLVYEGRGGPADREQALLLLWSAFRSGDYDALEELGDLLTSYSEELQNPQGAKRAAAIAAEIEGVGRSLRQISTYMYNLTQVQQQ
jgi:TPR repeat protein